MVKFSIVTISYNQAQYLETCIQSVITQNRELFEYIVVDPGSKDESRLIIDQSKNYIHKVIYENDKGPADGLNKGFAEASGDYLLFINADDILLPGALNKISNLLELYKQPKLLLCAGWMIDQNGRPMRRLFSTRFRKSDLFNHRTTFFQQGMVIRRDLFNKIGGFNPKNKTCWDYELLVDSKITGAKPLISTSRVAAFRIHSESISGGSYGAIMKNLYATDLGRVHYKLFPNKNQKSNLNLSLLERFQKYILTPEILFLILHDKLFSNRMIKIWENDMLE
jgi:glycosyltransferase involved in cell wall biosynthesis